MILAKLLVGTLVPTIVVLSATAADAQSARIFLPRMPLSEALLRIGAMTGTSIDFDPDAVRNLTSAPVRDVKDAGAAVRQAIRGAPLAVSDEHGRLMVTRDIVVEARRDEAEINLLVNATSTSSRMGQSLRDQPRNTAVISSKLLEQQQVLTISDALRNTSGITVNTGTPQSGNTYTVRGFSSAGIVNGMPAAANGGGLAGGTQPIANIERIEVLKGPDALLAGADNMGGTINIVTKKPYAGQMLTVTGEAGSFGQERITVDANNALDGDGRWSARLIGVAGTASSNFGGYRGNEDYLLAPSLRFKTARTDIIVDLSTSKQVYGANPFTAFNVETGQPIERPVDLPFLTPDQGISIGSTRVHADVTQKIDDWLTLVLRGQHEAQRIRIATYTPGNIAANGDVLASGSSNEQQVKADAIDGYLKAVVTTGPFKHLIVVGAMHVWNDTATLGSSGSPSGIANFFVGNQVLAGPIAGTPSLNYTSLATQFGQYGQYMLEFWRLKLLAGVRRNHSISTLNFVDGSAVRDPGAPSVTRSRESGTATVPNFGAILTVTPALSLYGSAAYGYSPTFTLDFNGNKLPDTRTRNLEAGIKLGLFGDHALLNVSYFDLRQSSSVVADPAHAGFNTAVPGQRGRGVDVNLAGRILAGWSAQAGLTRTNYDYLTPSILGTMVVAQPRDQYNIYTSYSRTFRPRMSGGLGVGVFGRSSAAADPVGIFIVPPSIQMDMNAFLTLGPVNLNLGVRNVLDRRNYGITYTKTYLPFAETRNWRLTASWRFW